MVTSGLSRRNWANVQPWSGSALRRVGFADSSLGQQGRKETSCQANFPQRVQRKSTGPQRCADLALPELAAHPDPEPGEVAPRPAKAADPQKRSPLEEQ